MHCKMYTIVRLLNKLLQRNGPTHGKRSRGRPNRSGLDCIKEECYIVFIHKSNVEDMAIAGKSGGH